MALTGTGAFCLPLENLKDLLAACGGFQRFLHVETEDPVTDKDLTVPPVSPSTADRYIVGASATGAWSGHDKAIAEYNGATWDFTTPDAAETVWVTDETAIYTYTSGAWTEYMAASAEGNIYLFAEDEENLARPYAVIFWGTADTLRSEAAFGGSQNFYTRAGSAEIYFARDIPSAYVDSWSDAMLDFNNLAGQAMDDMDGLSGSGTYLNVTDWQKVRGPARAGEEEGGNYIQIQLRVSWQGK